MNNLEQEFDSTDFSYLYKSDTFIISVKIIGLVGDISYKYAWTIC